MLILNLPYPPSVNSYWRANGHRRFISKEGVAFKQAVADYVIENNIEKLGDAPLSVFISLFPRDKRRTDIDNRIKAVLDSLQDCGVYDDDTQVQFLTVMRMETVKGGKCVVVIERDETTVEDRMKFLNTTLIEQGVTMGKIKDASTNWDTDWNEDRIDVVGQNGNEGLHYDGIDQLSMEDEELKKEMSKWVRSKLTRSRRVKDE
jgi:crossover junction endodeoxyribonuclease RusA